MAAGQVVLVTGASRGFGAAAARLLASRGNTVVATMRNPARDAAAVREGLEGRIEAAALDVTHPDEVRAVVTAALTRHGRLDAVINNAGYGLFGPIEEASDAELWRQLDTNLLGQWRVLCPALPAMRAASRGKIVNVSSLAGRVPGPFLGHYGASKHAVEAMSEALRFETAGSGVEVCVVEPGMYASDWQTTSLDVSALLRDGRSAYPAASRALAAFRAQGATRPGSASVGAALADIVHLEQRLPLRWPVGNDSVQMTALRLASSDEQWRFLLRSGALGPFRRWMFEGEDRVAPAAAVQDWSAPQVVFLAGASRGFGAAAARECALRGHTVVATMRNPARDGARLRQGLEERIHVLPLDVTDDRSVVAAVAETIARFGRVDVLVNNTSQAVFGPVEEMGEDEVRRQLDTNVLGHARLLRAVLPHMRERRSGKVVAVSAIAGAVPGPLLGFFAAAKHALEAMSEALADEVESWGIQVCVVQPGMYRSDGEVDSVDVSQVVREGRSRFRPAVERMLDELRTRAATRPAPDAVAAAIADVVQLQQPLPLRWPVGDDAIRVIRARRATPDDEWEQRMVASGWCFRPNEGGAAPSMAV